MRVILQLAFLAVLGAACSKSSGGSPPPAANAFPNVANKLYDGSVEDSDGSIYAATLQFFEDAPEVIEFEMRYAIGSTLFVRDGYARFYGNTLAGFMTLTNGDTVWTCWTPQPSGRLAVRGPIDPPPLPVADFFLSDFGAPAAAALLTAPASGELLSW